ncbi:MAG: hypothetical protein EBV71_04335, partial [Chitinophagia bacterium]|nr:hypothetical protein [Chitinophagia bacterium]
GYGKLLWGTSAATFALDSMSFIEVSEGTFIGGSSANEIWTNNKSNLIVSAGATFNGVEANVRVNALYGAGEIKSGHSHASYANFTFGVDGGSGNFQGSLKDESSSANFVKVGSGTQTLSGYNTYTGTTTISGGTLQIGDGGNLGSLYSSSIINNAGLNFNRSNDLTYAGTISGSGIVTKLGGGTLTLSGNNTYAGNTNVLHGNLVLQGYPAQLSSVPNYNIYNNGTLTFGRSDVFGIHSANIQTVLNIYDGGIVTNSGSSYNRLSALNFLGNGILTSTGSASGMAWALAGGVTVAAGKTASITGTGAVQLGSNTVTGTTFTTDNGSNLSVSANLTDGSTTMWPNPQNSSFLTKLGNGTLTLSGNNTFRGGTTINGGTLSISSDANLGTAPGTSTPSHLVLNGGTLAYTGSGALNANRGISLGTNGGTINVTSALSYGGIIANASGATGSLTKSGPGELKLSGNNTYTGATNVFAGTLGIYANPDPTNNIPGSVGTGTLTLSGGSKLSVGPAVTAITNNIVLGSGGGSIEFAPMDLEYLIVGGGGGGGTRHGGGGGGGLVAQGVISLNPTTFTTSIPITVGSGGEGATNTSLDNTVRTNTSGGTSSLGIFSAAGGKSGVYYGFSQDQGAGPDGGWNRPSPSGSTTTGGSGRTGTNESEYAGGGGGGAGGAGSAATLGNGGNGGIGVSSSITGTLTSYGGGGGGSISSVSVGIPGSGGSGGGGDGSKGAVAATSGTNRLGGGGGAGGFSGLRKGTPFTHSRSLKGK